CAGPRVVIVTGATVNNESENPEQPASPADETKAQSAEGGAGSGVAPEAAPASGAEAAATPESLEAEIARLKDRLLRPAADSDNYRKRTRRDITDAERRVQENLIHVLVQPFDNLERAVQHAESAHDVKTVAEGLKMVLRQF